MSVAERLAEVREHIDAAARASGRDPSEVMLVTVTKEIALDPIRAAIEAGAHDLGENRAQELVRKAAELGDITPALRWHFVGRLQRNKIRALAPHVALWQSLDRDELAVELGRRAPGAAVLVQVNVGGEAQKGGCAPRDTARLVEVCRASGCAVQGLMTVPPVHGDPRPHFAALRALTDDLGLDVCSMGMSGDYQIAIAEGSTMVRVGSAIFGPRPSAQGARR